MSLSPTALTPAAGAGLPATGSATPPLLRPVSTNLIGGTLPSAIATFVIGGTGDYAEHAADRAAHARRQAALAANGGYIAVFGDSNTKGSPVQFISPFAEQYAISGDTTAGLVARLRENPNPSAPNADYSSLSNAAAVALTNVPFNDICVASPNMTTIETNYATLMAYFTGPLVILPPVANTTTPAWNTNIIAFNTWLNSNFGSRSNTVIVDVHDFNNAGGVLSDGQHWDGPTKTIMMGRVQTALRSLLG